MSPILKKRLCWNCEGGVSQDLDNCPYCGVYVQGALSGETNSIWNPSYRPEENSSEEVHVPPYQIQIENDPLEEIKTDNSSPSQFQLLFNQLKKELFPTLCLMAGSTFFLFGIVLFLFSENGKLTLQWEASDALYFLIFSIPLSLFGWKFLQEID